MLQYKQKHAAIMPLVGTTLGALYGGFQGLRHDQSLEGLLLGGFTGAAAGGLAGAAFKRLFIPVAAAYLLYRTSKDPYLKALLPPPLQRVVRSAGDTLQRGISYVTKPPPTPSQIVQTIKNVARHGLSRYSQKPPPPVPAAKPTTKPTKSVKPIVEKKLNQKPVITPDRGGTKK